MSCSDLWGSFLIVNNHLDTAYPARRVWQQQAVVLAPARQHCHLQLCLQAITRCRSSTSSFHIFLWSAASAERSAIFTARMTGSGETAWMTPITMTYLPVTIGAGGLLFSDNGFMKTGISGCFSKRTRQSCEVIFRHNVPASAKQSALLKAGCGRFSYK